MRFRNVCSFTTFYLQSGQELLLRNTSGLQFFVCKNIMDNMTHLVRVLSGEIRTSYIYLLCSSGNFEMNLKLYLFLGNLFKKNIAGVYLHIL